MTVCSVIAIYNLHSCNWRFIKEVRNSGFCDRAKHYWQIRLIKQIDSFILQRGEDDDDELDDYQSHYQGDYQADDDDQDYNQV